MDKNAERAEQLREEIFRVSGLTKAETISLIKQALDEVVRDSDAHRDMWLDISRKAREEGVREGLRRAAGIIRNGPPPGSVICVDGDVCDPGVVSSGYMKWVADKIEAEARGIK